MIHRYLSLSFLKYLLGRFVIIRILTKKKKKFFNNINKFKLFNNNLIIKKEKNSFYLDKINKLGFSKKISLNKKVLKFIRDNMKNSTFLYKSKKNSYIEFNNLKEVETYNKKSTNKPIPYLTVKNPSLYKYFKKISLNKKIFNIAKEYLGSIKKIDISLNYSTVCKLNDEDRESSYQTVNWHYDVHDTNFLYVFFYISKSDNYSGAHQLIKSSHNNKPLKFLFSSAKKRENALIKYYKRKNIYTISGKQGDGFFEDTSCFHRALAPILKPRLCLQIRYS